MTPPLPTPQEVTTAYHEAGHAVVALALGRPVQQVSIRPNATRLGECQLKKGAFRPTADALETQVLILLAGLAAEGRRLGRYDWDGATLDLREARSLLRSRAGRERALERLERRMLDKAEHLLADDATWAAVERIAAELLLKETISGRAARHLFELAAKQAAR